MKDMELIVKDKQILELVMKEYMETVDTVIPLSGVHFRGYIPCVYDLINAFPGQTWESVTPIIFSVVMEEHIHIRWQDEILNKPIWEVW